MAEAYSGWSTNYADYRMRGYVNAYVSKKDDDNVWITVDGNAYFDAACLYGIAGQVGHAATSDVAAQWSGDIDWACLSTHTNGAYGSATYGPFPRKGDAYNVYCWYKTWGKTVSGYGAWRWGGTEAGVNVTVPAIEYYKPHQPKNVSVSRVSDSSQKIAWEANHTGMNGHYPWTGVHVDRRADDGAWVNIKDVSWDITNWTDNSTEAGHKYAYALRSYGPGGTSDRTSELVVYTTPLAFMLSTSKSDTGSVVMVAASSPMYYESIESEISTDGKTWASVELNRTGRGFEDTAPPAGTVYYRIRAVQSGLKGEWAYSGAVITICPPGPPGISGLSGAYAFDGTSANVAFTIIPNHPDRTDPSAQQVEFTLPDGNTESMTLPGGQSLVTKAVSSKGSYKVRARTKGVDPSWGEWSRYYVFNVANAPQTYFTNPASDSVVIGEIPINVSWNIADETGVSYVKVSLLDTDGNEVESITPATDATSWNVGAYSTIKNDASYTLVLDVRGGSGLTVRAMRRFTTHWYEPAPPKIAISYDDELAGSILIEKGSTEYTVDGTVLVGPMSIIDGGAALSGKTTVDGKTINLSNAVAEAVSFDVSRVNPDGTMTKLASKLTGGSAAFDRLPPLNVKFYYVVTAYAFSGTSTEVVVPTICRSKFAAMNFGRDGGTFLRAGFNPTSSHGVEHSRELYHFADNGENGGLPMRYDLDEMDVSLASSWQLYDIAQANAVRELSRRWSWCWFRDLDGNRATVAVDMEVERESSGLKRWSVSASMTESVWEEPVNGDV